MSGLHCHYQILFYGERVYIDKNLITTMELSITRSISYYQHIRCPRKLLYINSKFRNADQEENNNFNIHIKKLHSLYLFLSEEI